MKEPAAKRKLSLKTRIAVLAATLVLGGALAGIAIKQSRDQAAANRALRVAEGLRQNERMANGKDCTWDGRSR